MAVHITYRIEYLERLNFPIKYFIRPFLSLFPVCFPVSTRQIARYPPHKNRKTSSKTILKPQAEQNLNGS